MPKNALNPEKKKEFITRTLPIATDLDPQRFLPLMKRCAGIFNAHVDWALANHTYNKNRAHADLYNHLCQANPDIPTGLVQTTRDEALESVKSRKFKGIPRKKMIGSLRLDKRLITLRGEQVSVSCLGKRAKTILTVPEPFRDVFCNWRFVGATLVYKRHERRLWLNLIFKTEKPALQPEQQTQGIDLGLHHLAVTSDGDRHSNAEVRAVQRRYLHTRRTLQAKGTRSAKRRLRAMSGREQRFSRNVTHSVTKKLAAQENVTTFVLEDLSGIRNQRRGRKMNKCLSSWPFYQFKQFLGYKAEALGKRVVFVDARYTSQKCNRCKHIYKGNRHKSHFQCVRCGFSAHADVNAATNIRDTHLLSAAP